MRGACGDVCILLHADTTLPHNARAGIEAALARNSAGGAFLLQFKDGALPWLAFATGMDLTAAASQGLVPYLIGDVVKTLLAAALLPVTWLLINRRQDSNDRY